MKFGGSVDRRGLRDLGKRKDIILIYCIKFSKKINKNIFIKIIPLNFH